MSDQDEDNSTPIYSELDIEHIKNVDADAKLTKKFVRELNKDKAFKEYLSNFRADCLKTITQDFARFKANYQNNAKWKFARKEQIDLHFVKEAEDIIWYIQQKKLFDLQCRWRAEQIEIPGITITHEFDYWSKNIKNCNFIDPITEDEVELLQEYLASYSFSENIFTVYDWQDYETFKEEHLGDPEGLEMPEWYQFYNMHRGTESLLLLPDYKEELQQKYISNGMHSKDEAKKKVIVDKVIKEKEEVEEDELEEDEFYDEHDPPPTKTPKLIAPQDTRPRFYADNENIGKFIELFEDSRLKEIYDIRLWFDEYSNIDKWDMAEFNEALELLRYAGPKYPMQPYHCWRKGIIRLAIQFKNRQIINALPLVFEDYKMRNSMGIAHFVNRQDQAAILDKKKFTDMFLAYYHLGKSESENNKTN